jgi:hypothetical protein
MLYNCAWLFKILDKVIHSISLSTEQLHIQWTASQWTKWVVQKKRQWFARENGDYFSQLSSTTKRHLWSNTDVTVPGISKSSKQLTHF